LTYAGLVVGLARSILVILRDAQVMDTLTHALAATIQHWPSSISAIGIYIIQNLLHFLVPSGSGQAAVSMPILAPLGDLLGITRQTNVLAYQLGNGLTNVFIPTQGYFMAALGILGIPWSKWVRWLLPLLLMWIAIGCGAVLIAHGERILVAQRVADEGVLPDGEDHAAVGVAEVDAKGNLVHQHFESEQRIQFSSQNKRDNDVRLLAKRVVDLAKEKGKPLVVEKLNFKKKKTNGKKDFKKFRRMKHNFLHKKIIVAIKSRAAKEGVLLIEINPAFTSKLGHLKYERMYSLPIHCAAAMVIARRGMGIVERRTFVVRKADKPARDGKIPWNLEGRHGSCTLSGKAWSWLEDKFLRSKKASLTGTRLEVVPRTTTRRSVGWQATGEPIPTTGRDGHGDVLGEERLPEMVFGLFQKDKLCFWTTSDQ
jgi:IS605 OrfB family transposase